MVLVMLSVEPLLYMPPLVFPEKVSLPAVSVAPPLFKMVAKLEAMLAENVL